jgi:hypothetical protein
MLWITLSRQAQEESSAKLLHNFMFAGDYTLHFYALGGLYLVLRRNVGLSVVS